ncbi:MAG TPA: LytTR family DNA-binding domain-containing protein [Burkholderiaceae bacterium]|nr:LytTR family DNA-binding domain-containing protein [Burkholderiaceae bacterium]
MPTALIADDEAPLAQALQRQLATLWPELAIVAVARNGLEAAKAIAEHEPDVAFLDIQMPGLTGLEVAQGIEGRTRVVFVTAFDEYAVQAFEQSALDYLLKPAKAERLARTVEKVRSALATREPAADDAALAAALQRLLPQVQRAAQPLRWVRASVGEFTHQIDVREVLCFEADEKYTVVRTAAGAEHLIRTPIVELIAQLDGEHFWQIHRSTVINVEHLAGTRRDEASRLFVRMKGLVRELPVSRAYVHLFKAM